MNSFFGLDFGSRMIKLASVASSSGVPQIVPLSQQSPFLAACLSLDGTGSLGWEAFQNRQRLPQIHLEDFRDYSSAENPNVTIDGQSVSTKDLMEFLVELLGRQLSQSTANSFTAIAVPDVWPDGGWAFAAGLGTATWKPNVAVRESAAAWRSLNEELPPSALLISCGYSGLVASQIQLKSGHWHYVGRSRSKELSGRLLREKLANKTAHIAVEAIRYDPREDSEADQAMHDANEQLLIQLCSSDMAHAQLLANGNNINLSQSKGQISDLMPDARRIWHNFILAHQDKIEKRPVYLWGELAQLLPLADWTQETVGSGCSVQVLDLDAVATGAALLSADISEQGIDHFNENLGEIGSSDGRWQQSDAMRIAPGCIPLVNATPVRGDSADQKFVTLELFDEKGPSLRSSFNSTSISLGRDPSCSLAIDQDQYPMVSGNHAVISSSPSSSTGFFLEDLSSTNGTFVNEVQVVDRLEVEDGSLIRLGLNGPKIRLYVS